MKSYYLYMLVSGVLLIGCNASPTAVDNTNQPSGFQLVAELRDGSRIIGKVNDEEFQFQSDVLGEVKLPVERIRSIIDCPAKTNVVQLTTTNGDTLTVRFITKAVRVETAFGKFKLPVNLIQRIGISPLRKSGLYPSDLVALWSGNGDGIDSVGGHNAMVPPGVTYAPAKNGQGFNLDGRDHRIVVPDAPALNFGPNQDFSLSAWIMPLPPPPRLTSDIMSIVDKRYAPDSSHCQGYEVHLVNGRLDIRVSDSSAKNGTDWGSSGPDLRDGSWHHIAVTLLRNSPTGGHLYVDGQVVLTFDPTGEAGDLSNTEPLRIGNHSDPNYFTFFHGIINEVSLYNRALSDSEIQTLYAEEH